MSDYVRYREEKGLSNNQIIRTVAEGYPGYTKIQNTMVNNPQKYGICLLPEAEKLEQEVDDIQKEIINSHIQRLMQVACDPAGGVIYTDISTDLERCSDHAINIAGALAEIPEENK